jgi:hypothetical protein
MLRVIRQFAFAVALAAGALGAQVLQADDQSKCSESQGPCESCETPVGYCMIAPGGGSCSQWAECTHVVFCGSTQGGGGTLCNCGPCELEN